MSKTYQDFLTAKSVLEGANPGSLPASVTTNNYEQAQTVLALLEAAGIPTLITEGGLSVKIDSETSYNTAQEILGKHGLEVEAGDTVAAETRGELRRVKNENQ